MKIKMTFEELLNQQMFECSNEIGKYTCRRCPNYHTNFLATLKYHIRDGHRDKSSEECAYKCLKCLFVTYSEYLMGRHSLFGECATMDEDERKKRFICYRKDHPEFNFMYDVVKTSYEKNFANTPRFKTISKNFTKSQNTICVKWLNCEQCSYKAERASRLKQHIIYLHTNPEDIEWFTCEQCPQKFKTKGNLKSHFLACHIKSEDIQWFGCEQCPLKFKRKANLNSHIILRHLKPEDIQWFVCDLCPSKFKRNADLKKHTRSRHKAEVTQWFKCEQCPATYSEKSYLKKHITVRHTKPEDINWFLCHQCPCKFKQKKGLKRHQLCHSKLEVIQWFKCERCPCMFKQKSTLTKHVKCTHTEQS